MIKAVFTRHAFDRVEERLKITEVEVARILDSGETIPLMQEPGTHRLHLLFYSKADEQCFVAIQDQRDGTVVTILPPDFVNRYRVSLEVISDLMNPRSVVPRNSLSTKIDHSVSCYIFLLYFRSKNSETRRRQKIRIAVSDFPADISLPGLLLDDPRSRSRIAMEVQRHIQPWEILDGVSVRAKRLSPEPLDISKFDPGAITFQTS